MRKLVLIMTASVDGYVVAPDGMSIGAEPEPAELKSWKLNRIRQAGTHIMGRASYEESGTILADIERRLCGAHERHTQGGILQDAQVRDLA